MNNAELNDNQRKLVEENMNLVYGVVKRYYPTFIYDEEIISSGLLGLCKAALTWDSSKGKFSTWANACIRNGIRGELRYRQPHLETVSLNEPIGEDISLEDTIESEDETDEISVSNQEFRKRLTNREKQVFDLKLDGYTLKEISKITGYPHNELRSICKKIRLKYHKKM